MSDAPELSRGDSSDGFEQLPSRFIVGIDLGTTNCAVAYIDTGSRNAPLAQGASTSVAAGGAAAAVPNIENFSVQQWVDFGTQQRRDLLPSFLYQPLPAEVAGLQAPTPERRSAQQPTSSEPRTGQPAERIVGGLARDRGLQLPGRQVSSAKSWLCHDGVDRRSPILPWHSDDGVERISPVAASAELLAHIRRTWDQAHPTELLSEQDIVLTLPASFDQVARQLTIEAAAAAGLSRIMPIEEPQAAFYAWLALHTQDWEAQVQMGQTILICDIGGGTTDFTLIRVRAARPASDAEETAAQLEPETLDARHRAKYALHRVAVGQHLILGGDNIDLALARLAETKLTGGGSLPIRAWDALRQACRVAKETLLGQAPPPSATMHLPGSGSKLIAAGRQVEITQAEVRSCVLDGFFPNCELHERPAVEQVGIQEFGLPFAKDPAITKHLATFLWEHRWAGRDDLEREQLHDFIAARPDWILFNGGVMSSPQLRERIVEVIGNWFAGHADSPGDWQPGVLRGERLDLAVARGAAYFGQVRRGTGVEIEANLARSFYLQTSQSPPQAVCIVPGSASAGDRFALRERPMELAVGQPVQFPIIYSSTRLADRLGETVAMDAEHFASLPPIRTVIETRRGCGQAAIPVYVEVELSQIGTLHMYCHACDSDQRWKLEFDVRGSTQTDHTSRELSQRPTEILDEQSAQVARQVLERTFSESGDLPPAKLMSELSAQLSLSKSQWPPYLLRSMWSSLLELEVGRRLSPQHEARWLNLLGYALRPGYGLAADDWRVAQTWRSVHGKLCFASPSSRNESLILWRRIAGGFTAGQQLTVYQQVAGPLRGVLDPVRRGKGGATLSPQELIELLRMVGSLELLPKSEKAQLGSWLLELLSVKRYAPARGAVLWTIGRLGSRSPTYGPLNCVVDTTHVESWLEQLLKLPVSEPELALALMLCARRVQDRYRDIDAGLRELVCQRLVRASASEHWLTLVRDGGTLVGEEADQVWGEALPLGLTFRN